VDESLITYTNTAVNVELVCVILLGINGFLDNRMMKSKMPVGSRRQTKMEKEKTEIKIERTREDTNITFNNLMFEDLNFWED
jgi:hypothetical protein